MDDTKLLKTGLWDGNLDAEPLIEAHRDPPEWWVVFLISIIVCLGVLWLKA